jgi:polyhydroxybutyrate depolymerase
MRRRGSGIVAATVLVAALALAACSSGSGAGAGNAGGPDSPTDADATADCDPPRPAEATAAPQTFRFGDDERAYLLALPDDYDGTTAYPLVFSFHGFAGSKEGHNANTAMAEKGTARGYVVITPDALGEPRDWKLLRQPRPGR